MGEGVDMWWWKSEEGALFTVQTCYVVLEKLRILEDGGGMEEEAVFNYL